MLLLLFFFYLQTDFIIKDEKKIETEIFNYQFNDALNTLENCKSIFTPYRFGAFKAVIYFYCYFSDQPANRRIQYVDSMQKALARTIEDKDKILGEKKSDDLLMLGGAYGLIGMAEYLKKNRFSALKYAGRAKKLLDNLIETDSTVIDAYFGIGIYNYSLSKPPAILRFFLFLLGYSGDYDLGISQLKEVALHGKDTKIQSLLYLINHALYEDKYYKKIFPFFKQFPKYLQQTPMFLYKRILFEYKLGMYSAVQKTFEKIDLLKMPTYIKSRSQLTLARAEINLKHFNKVDSLITIIRNSSEHPKNAFLFEIRETEGDKFFARNNYKKAYENYIFIYKRTSVTRRKERIENKLEKIEELTNGNLDY